MHFCCFCGSLNHKLYKPYSFSFLITFSKCLLYGCGKCISLSTRIFFIFFTHNYLKALSAFRAFSIASRSKRKTCSLFAISFISSVKPDLENMAKCSCLSLLCHCTKLALIVRKVSIQICQCHIINDICRPPSFFRKI
jgi:hypothetical protein